MMRNHYVTYDHKGNRVVYDFIPEYDDAPDIFARKETMEKMETVSVNGMQVNLTESKEIIVVYIHMKMFCDGEYCIGNLPKELPDSIDFKDYGYDIKLL